MVSARVVGYSSADRRRNDVAGQASLAASTCADLGVSFVALRQSTAAVLNACLSAFWGSIMLSQISRPTFPTVISGIDKLFHRFRYSSYLCRFALAD
jgi:hypothetical protein